MNNMPVAPAIILVVLSLGVQSQDCVDGEFQLANNFTQTPYKNNGDYVKEFIGILEICYNGTYYSVCSGGQQIAELACSNLGYNNGNHALIAISGLLA